MKRTSRTSLSAVPWWCLWCAVGCQALVNRAGSSWNGHDYHTYPHPAKKPVVPRDIMVNVINRLGLDLLAIHNEYNENNIAISPYGALSVLIALGEGLQGDAVREIQYAAHIPNDISIIRIGLRDIHRHLKSYFIPREGFLAGLTLNHENVTLRPEYEEILKFYGYDAPTFNNALYPEPLPTEKLPPATIPEATSHKSPPTTPLSITTAVPSSSEEKATVITTESMPTEKPLLETIPETTSQTPSPTTTLSETTAVPPSSEESTSVTTTEKITTVSMDARELDTVAETSTQSASTTTPESVMTLQPEFMIATTTKELTTTTLEPVVKTTEIVTTPGAPEIETMQPISTTTQPAELPLGVTTTITPEPVSTPEITTTSLESATMKLEPETTTAGPVTEITEPVGQSLEPITTEPAFNTPQSTTLEPITTERTTNLAEPIPESVTTMLVESTSMIPEQVTTTKVSVTTTLEPEATTEALVTVQDYASNTPTAASNILQPLPMTLSPVMTEQEPIITTTEAVITTQEPTTIKPEPVPTTEESVITTLEPILTTGTTLEPVVISTESMGTTFESTTTLEPVHATFESVISRLGPAMTTLEPVTTNEAATTVQELVNTPLEGETTTSGSTTTNLAVAEPETVVVVEDEPERTTTEAVTTIISEGTEGIPAASTTLVPTEPTETVQENSIDNEILMNDVENSGLGFAGASKRRARSQFNVVELNKWRGKHAATPRREIRSVADYLIARYHDDHHAPFHFQRPFAGEEQPSFLVQGKYREYRINYMKYDTVLPFVYVIDLDALALTFPLDSSKYYLLLLLPRDENGVDKLICDLRRHGSLRPIVDNLRYKHVIATIPSFMLKGYVTLTPSFQQLGIKRVFEPRQSDFSPMTDQQGIYVRNIEQAITVNIRNYVDPNKLATNRRLQDDEPVEFKADHPFLYFVMDSELHIVLMEGKVVNPLNSRIR